MPRRSPTVDSGCRQCPWSTTSMDKVVSSIPGSRLGPQRQLDRTRLLGAVGVQYRVDRGLVHGEHDIGGLLVGQAQRREPSGQLVADHRELSGVGRPLRWMNSICPAPMPPGSPPIAGAVNPTRRTSPIVRRVRPWTEPSSRMAPARLQGVEQIGRDQGRRASAISSAPRSTWIVRTPRSATDDCGRDGRGFSVAVGAVAS